MSFLDRTERTFFKDGPKILLFIAAIFGLTPVLLLGNALFAGWPDGPFLRVLLIAALPALLCLALSWAVRRRHLLSVPLTWALCLMSLLTIRGGFGSAIEGITPQWMLKPMLWVATTVELVAIAFFAVFVTLLWRKGRFDGGTG